MSQKRILETYAKQNGFTNLRWYTDDGFSGANFQRPGFQAMLADIEAGKVGTVIVKDMSRLGRNYLQVGFYTEMLFPQKGVRFIAVNDNVDSASEGMDNDFTPLRNLFNEWLVRDTSKKIKTVKKSKGMSGKPVTSKPVYGYVMDEDENFIIDEEAAPVVQQIYQLCLAGNGPTKIARISEIEAKLNAGKGYRYDQAMKVVKLKQMAKTLIYLEEKGFADFDALVNAAADAEKQFYALKATIKAAEARMGEIQTLRTHIMNYSRTRSVYTGYRKAGYSKKYLAEHEGDILIHKAAKKAFDAFGLKKLPTVRSLNEEFARLLAEKKAAYAEYHRAQEQMRELLIHKANAACLLGLNEQNRQTTERQREEK